MRGEYKVPGGKLVAVDVEVSDGRIAMAAVSGDFFLLGLAYVNPPLASQADHANQHLRVHRCKLLGVAARTKFRGKLALNLLGDVLDRVDDTADLLGGGAELGIKILEAPIPLVLGVIAVIMFALLFLLTGFQMRALYETGQGTLNFTLLASGSSIPWMMCASAIRRPIPNCSTCWAKSSWNTTTTSAIS